MLTSLVSDQQRRFRACLLLRLYWRCFFPIQWRRPCLWICKRHLHCSRMYKCALHKWSMKTPFQQNLLFT